MLSEHQKETNFLRQLIRYDPSAQRRKLEDRLTATQGDERCVRRAVHLMALLSAMAMAGLCYAQAFLMDDPKNKWRVVIHVVCGLGLASVTSFVAFGGYWLAYRRELNRRREECRRLIIDLLEYRLGKAGAMPAPSILQELEPPLASDSPPRRRRV